MDPMVEILIDELTRAKLRKVFRQCARHGAELDEQRKVVEETMKKITEAIRAKSTQQKGG